MSAAEILMLGIVGGFGGSLLGTGWSLWKRERYAPGTLAGIVGTGLIALVVAIMFKR